MGKRKQKKQVSESKEGGHDPKLRRIDSTSDQSPSHVHKRKDERLLWGPYLSERQWGTVREDLSSDSNCWESFSHEQAVYRSYAWGEDGLLGISDDQAQLCLALALWNGKDPILKERLYGMTGPQGNHGEDVKECYYYLDSLPCHGYMKALYKYPQRAFPYDGLLEESEARDATQPEYELSDTRVFSRGDYFDVFAEYAKRSDKDILCKYTVHNRGAETSAIHILPQLWFRNTWGDDKEAAKQCRIQKVGDGVICTHPNLGRYIFEFEPQNDQNCLYTENETNTVKLKADTQAKHAKQTKGIKTKGKSAMSPSKASSKSTVVLGGTKDAFHEYIINGNIAALNAKAQGTKFGVHYQLQVPARGHVTVRCRLVDAAHAQPLSFDRDFEAVFERKLKETHEFYKQVLPRGLTDTQAAMARQAYAGLCWNKQYFGYHLSKWLALGGEERINKAWGHMINSDVISMPDKWEFPWYATWDLAFHMVPMADLDAEFAKQQLLLFLSQRYMHPTGQLPAYEFDFSDVNPPVHALAVLHVYRLTRDRAFLLTCFNKLMLNYNWWVNKKQVGRTWLFAGGFLGMDNVSCLHRSQLPPGCTLYQVDGTCWMAYFSLCMLQMALALTEQEPAYADMVVMYLDYFLSIAHALNFGLNGTGLWDAKDGFYYDYLKVDGEEDLTVLRVRAMIGLTSLFPVYTLPTSACENNPCLKDKVNQLLDLRREIVDKLGICWEENGLFLSAIPRSDRQRLESVLRYLADDKEFLAPHGIRSLSKVHADRPCSVRVGGEVHTVEYNPGESRSDMFGGNSNWRGPIWFPMNYMVVESLEAFYRHYGDALVVRSPSSAQSVACFVQDVCTRLVSIFLPDHTGGRPCHGKQMYSADPHWQDLVLFYEYFDGDTGRGCGASHQTGWTALVTTILKKLYP